MSLLKRLEWPIRQAVKGEEEGGKASTSYISILRLFYTTVSLLTLHHGTIITAPQQNIFQNPSLFV